jgi:uncharacterized protein
MDLKATPQSCRCIQFAPWLLLLASVYTAAASAAIDFPRLTGRVVDEANLLSPKARAQLTERLAQHERDTTHQVVVVTLNSLQGRPIEDYGYQLGRTWGIGQKDRNNGALLIIAPHERKIRIEVGYGLEGTLTDALSRNIIETRMTPHFRSGNFESGIVDGALMVLAILEGRAVQLQASRAEVGTQGTLSPALGGSIFVSVFLIFIGQVLITSLRSRTEASAIVAALGFLAFTLMFSVAIGVGAALVFALLNQIRLRPEVRTGHGFSRSGSSGSSSSGSSFSGGGGSFGGGGASGSW